MMATILRLVILNSAILHKTLTQTNSIWFKLIHSDSTWWWQPSWILPCWIHTAILDSDTLLFPFKHTHTCQEWFPSFAQKNLIHTLWLNLMVAAILNSAIFYSDTLLSSLRFTQKHSHSTLTLTQTNSIWLKLIHSHLTWIWQPSSILPSWIPLSWIQSS